MRLPNFLKRYHLKDYKMNLVLLVLALSVIGVFVIGSAEPDNQSRQIIGLAFGLFVMVIVSLIELPPRRFLPCTPPVTSPAA